MPQTSPLLISTHSPGFQVFSSLSAVTSDTHTPALKGFRKRRSAVFWFTQAGRSPANAALKNVARRELSQKSSLNCRLVLISASPLKLPSHPPFEILHLPAGTFRSDEPISPSAAKTSCNKPTVYGRHIHKAGSPANPDFTC